MISIPDRLRAVELIAEAVSAGARQRLACREFGLTERTLQRWQDETGVVRADARPSAVRPVPANKLSAEERTEVLRIVNETRFSSLPLTQIVPTLADEGRYVAFESTMYRILREEKQLAHRGAARASVKRPVPQHCAHAANQLWCWDITYLPGPIKGMFFFLYLVMDVYSRKIVAHKVHAEESAEHAAVLIERAVLREGVNGTPLVIHQDNGSPMKGSTFVAKLQELGLTTSYSRPSVSDDNAYAESLFRTCKYRPEYPGAFASLEQARAWALSFERWYNYDHKHRNLKFVSPAQRHCGADRPIFANRAVVYEQARKKHPTRWRAATRDWSLPNMVWLNRPADDQLLGKAA